MNIELIKAFLKRIFSSLITLFLLISFLFVLIRLAPGDPTQKFLSSEFSPELTKKVSEDFKLDQPVSEQYFNFVVNVFKGDFGTSYNYRLPVLVVVWEFLSFTLFFSMLAFLIQVIVSYYLALKAVQNPGGKVDRAVSKISLAAYVTPSFVLGVFLIYLFSVQIDLFPSSGTRSLDYDSLSFVGKLADYFKHLVLPIITLSAAGTAMFYKYFRDSLDDIYQQNFVLNLRASGYDEKVILKKHIVPNAIRPLISIAGIELGTLLGGTLITEVIFGLPGMGRLMMDSIFSRDYPLVVGCALVSGVLMIVSNFIADLFKIKIDKRLLKGLMN